MGLLGVQHRLRVGLPQPQQLFRQYLGKARQQCRLHHKAASHAVGAGVRRAQIFPALLDLPVKEQGDAPKLAAVILINFA